MNAGAAGGRPPGVRVHRAGTPPEHFAAWRTMFEDAGYDCRAPALPGHAPSERAVLRRSGFDAYVAAMREVVAGLEAPPVLIGHSMGGLVARMVAAEVGVAALVLLAPLPGGRVPITAAALPFFAIAAPAVLLAQPFRPLRGAIRHLALNRLPRDEQDEIADGFVGESGRAYRDLVLGRAGVGGRAIRGGMLVMHGDDDRLIPAPVARGIADKHGAELMSVPGCGHWLIAPSLVPSVARTALAWIERQHRVDEPERQLREKANIRAAISLRPMPRLRERPASWLRFASSAWRCSTSAANRSTSFGAASRIG